MKKINILVLIILAFLLSSCVKEEEKVDPNKDLDLENVFFDDFTDGISSDDWIIGNTKWGLNNGGVIYENVNYTADGVVVLQSNGDLYEGDLVGIGRNHGKRTGSMIKTRDAFGPGKYEVRMKIMPRFGATTAMWTFYYDDPMNHEIDIELNVQNDFRIMMTTNWITETDSSTKNNNVGFPLNDGLWHTYRFDWRTNPSKIDYYLDDKLISTQESYVPTHAGEFNIGNWFPEAWAGVPDFETDYMYVDWFKHTPFLNNEYVETPRSEASPSNHYPKEPIEHPIANLISNGSFEYDNEAFRIGPTSAVTIINGIGIDGSGAIKVPKNDITYQNITGLDELLEYKLIANAKLPENGSGRLLMEFYPNETKKIGEQVITFDSKDKEYKINEFYKKEIVFNPPAGTKRVQISLIGDNSEIIFDDLFMNLTNRLQPTEKNVVETYEFFDDFSNGIDPNNWEISNRRWGYEGWGGVIHENVNYTKEGYAVLKANGDYYDGSLKGIGKSNGKRTGALLQTNKSFGPGSFEVKAKVLPRFGATSAFWTYYYESEEVNHEIDIEVNVENNFNSVWFTNWLGVDESSHTSIKKQTPVLNNDGEWHTYRFDWYTDNPRIEYYIDGVKYQTTTTNIPTFGMRFNIGMWFPNEWAGNPDFETDYMFVDYFKYTEFKNQPYVKTPDGVASNPNFYPKSPIEIPVANLISNGDMKSDLGYELENAKIINKELEIVNGSATQVITGLHEDLKMYLKVNAKGNNDSKISIKLFNNEGRMLEDKVIELNQLTTDYTLIIEEFDLVKDTRKMIISISGSNLVINNLFLNALVRI